MTSCPQCLQKNAINLSYTSKHYCKKHIRLLIERRIRRDMRAHQPFDLKKTYFVLADGRAETNAMLEILKRLFGERLSIKLITSPDEITSPFLDPLLLEEETSLMFEKFLRGLFYEPKTIRPLRTILAQELKHFTTTPLHPKIHPLLLNLEKKSPGTLFAMHKCLEKITIKK